MKRWLLVLFTASSLFAFAALSVLWVDSYWHTRSVISVREWYQAKKWTERALDVGSETGGISVCWSSVFANESDVEWGIFPERIGEWRFIRECDPAQGYPHLSDEVASGHEQFGFGFGSSNHFIHGAWRRGYQWELIVPYLALWILNAAMVAISIRVWSRRRRRPPEGLCRRCGYDLRAHRVGQKCPECGTLIQEPIIQSF